MFYKEENEKILGCDRSGLAQRRRRLLCGRSAPRMTSFRLRGKRSRYEGTHFNMEVPRVCGQTDPSIAPCLGLECLCLESCSCYEMTKMILPNYEMSFRSYTHRPFVLPAMLSIDEMRGQRAKESNCLYQFRLPLYL